MKPERAAVSESYWKSAEKRVRSRAHEASAKVFLGPCKVGGIVAMKKLSELQHSVLESLARTGNPPDDTNSSRPWVGRVIKQLELMGYVDNEGFVTRKGELAIHPTESVLRGKAGDRLDHADTATVYKVIQILSDACGYPGGVALEYLSGKSVVQRIGRHGVRRFDEMMSALGRKPPRKVSAR